MTDDYFKKRFGSSEQLPSDYFSSTENLHRCKRPKQHQSSISFNEDIFTEILLRLPVKSVLKFKSVSKLWFSIASSRRFRQTHASRQHREAAVALFFPINKLTFYARLRINFDSQIKPKIKFTSPRVKRTVECKYMSLTCVSSCNGLQLLVAPKRNSPDHVYYVYNPTTEECKEIIDIPLHVSYNKFVCASLAFDPYESLNYKVIFLCRGYEFPRNFQLEIYSSKTGTCKAPVSDTFVGAFDYDENCGIFCNGAIHWLSRDGALVVYFNVHTECINELELPTLQGGTIQYFGESQGHLHLVYSYRRDFSKISVLDVYELKRDYSSWFQKYQVDLVSIRSALPQQAYPRNDRGTFMTIFQNDDDDSTMVLLVGKEWVEHNFKKQTTKRLNEFVLPEACTSPFPWSYGFNTHQFIPNLICL